MADLLFVYGTLHPDRAPASILPTVRLLTPVGSATVQGTLYQFAGYPGLLIPGPSPREISGELFALPPDPTVLASLDEYEDFRPRDPAASLFLRVETRATRSDGSLLRCWVYIYNRSILSPIQA
jgi:gamma-glutamylcyclotransferase (GGCT)/AIG2-like uncharacterized protein YtfP